MENSIMIYKNKFGNKTIENNLNLKEKEELLQKYLKSRYNFSGKTLKNLKECLNKENNNFINDFLENCKEFSFKELKINDVFIGNQTHFSNVEPRNPQSKDDLIVIGIVVLFNNKLRLIDGYHRMKWSLEKDLKNGVFIILS